MSRAEAGSLVPVCGPQCSSPCSGQVLSSVCSANRALGVGVTGGRAETSRGIRGVSRNPAKGRGGRCL